MNEYEQYNWEQTKTVRCSETRDDRRRRSNACLMGRNDLGSHVTDGRIESCRESPKRVEPADSHLARSECIREAAVSVTRPGAWAHPPTRVKRPVSGPCMRSVCGAQRATSVARAGYPPLPRGDIECV